MIFRCVATDQKVGGSNPLTHAKPLEIKISRGFFLGKLLTLWLFSMVYLFPNLIKLHGNCVDISV